MADCKHYNGGDEPSEISIALHAAELVRRGHSSFSIPGELYENVFGPEKDFTVKLKWAAHGYTGPALNAAAILDIYLQRSVFRVSFKKWPWLWWPKKDDAKIAEDDISIIIPFDRSLATRFMEVTCGLCDAKASAE